MTTRTMEHNELGGTLQRTGTLLLRYGLALIFLWFGFLKFTAFEADGIAPLITHSPLLSWALDAFGKQGISNIIGVIEIAVGVLILTRARSARLSGIGSLGAAITFVITLTFLLSTPGVWQEGYGFPFLSGMVGQFLIKDLVLLAASIWTAGEAFMAAHAASQTTPGSNVLMPAAR
jgi:reactive chlorine resistance protein C